MAFWRQLRFQLLTVSLFQHLLSPKCHPIFTPLLAIWRLFQRVFPLKRVPSPTNISQPLPTICCQNATQFWPPPPGVLATRHCQNAESPNRHPTYKFQLKFSHEIAFFLLAKFLRPAAFFPHWQKFPQKFGDISPGGIFPPYFSSKNWYLFNFW